MLKQYRDLKAGEFIVVACDCSAGGEDRSAGQFISRQKIDVPLVYHSQSLATEMTGEMYTILNRIYDITGVKPCIAYERNNGGIFELERLASLNRLGKYTIFEMPGFGKTENSETHRLGWDTNTATRPAMLTALKEAIDKQLLKVYDPTTIEELYSFIVAKSSVGWKAQAEYGAHDDLVMALAIAWQLFLQAPEPDLMGFVEPITALNRGFEDNVRSKLKEYELRR